MTFTATKTVTRRPGLVRATYGLLLFLGFTAMAGGAALVFDLDSASIVPPAEWLAGIPLIHSWVVPGLVLGIGFGLGSLFTAFGMRQRPHWQWTRPIERLIQHHWSWIATIVIGLSHVVWIGLELIYLPFSALHVVYGLIGISLSSLPFTPSVRRDLETIQSE